MDLCAGLSRVGVLRRGGLQVRLESTGSYLCAGLPVAHCPILMEPQWAVLCQGPEVLGSARSVVLATFSGFLSFGLRLCR